MRARAVRPALSSVASIGEIVNRRIWAVAAAVVGMLAAAVLMTAPAASATVARDAPPGYGGPVSTCPGTYLGYVTLRDSSGFSLGSTLDIWYSSLNSGTFCAKTYDRIDGSHHMEVVIRRTDWQTPWYDSGMYTTYAGGVEVFGAATKCVAFFGRVTAGGVNYEGRTLLCGPLH